MNTHTHTHTPSLHLICNHEMCPGSIYCCIACLDYIVPGCVYVCLRFAVGVGLSGMFHVLILMFIRDVNCEVFFASLVGLGAI